jgi:hypothetical protein
MWWDEKMKEKKKKRKKKIQNCRRRSGKGGKGEKESCTAQGIETRWPDYSTNLANDYGDVMQPFPVTRASTPGQQIFSH